LWGRPATARTAYDNIKPQPFFELLANLLFAELNVHNTIHLIFAPAAAPDPREFPWPMSPMTRQRADHDGCEASRLSRLIELGATRLIGWFAAIARKRFGF
jgi:hypothetical protein